ncbi:MAG: hypothetical protein WCF84_25460 [Anaerolineae bacterium]
MVRLFSRALTVIGALSSLALLFVMLTLLVRSQGPSVQAAGPGPDVVEEASSPAAVQSAGVRIQVQYANTPPIRTPEQIQALQARQARAGRTGPDGPIAIAPTTGNPGPGFTPRHAAAPTAETDMTIFRDTVVPSAPPAGGPGANWQYTMEPSTGVNGKNNFYTGNWGAARSFDNGANWGFLDPYSIFPASDGSTSVSGFCCDQVTLYDPERDLEFWLLQYGNGLKLAIASGTDLYSSWCFYNITGASFGNASYDIDYNDMAIGQRDLYIASNLYLPKSSASGVLRWPVEALASCGGFSFNYLVRTDSFTLKPVQGASDIMYLGSNWVGTLGSTFRVYKWLESKSGYSYVTHTIATFSFEKRNSGQDCGSKDGVVKNWCQYADSRVLAGYRANGVIGFAFNSKACCGISTPFSRRVYFRESDLAYLSSHSLWCTVCSVQFLSLSPNRFGHVGGSFAWGGGPGGDGGHYYPGGGLILDDDVTPAAPWSFDTFLWGGGNTCQYNDNGSLLYRWGDYLTIRPFYPEGDAFIATNYAIKGGDCGTANAYAEPHSVIFGRLRDTGSYTRWSNN